ncbi:unnamed protein product [Caenorhabditis auriculariae]|uniref:G-protein coupled receptors family 1 profile domain-containing protein n=1 Tax=Caenorhabditis auriculariae TaxID=2777116 RepID=A0A8S1GYP7_9PELO|nr:unnamed protein product [Caenorhabditis auriculariae]
MDYDSEAEKEYEISCAYFECTIQSFSLVYDEIHIPLSISICLFGAMSNIFNIIVLTRHWLLATNYFSFLVLEYYRMQCIKVLWTRAFTWYRFFNVNFNTVFHTIAFATTIIVAVFRYCALKFPIQANRFIYKTKLAVTANIFIWLIVPLISAPVFFISEVKSIDVNLTAYNLNCSMEGELYDLSYQGNPPLVSAVFWTFGIVFKLLPSVVLTILLIALIKSLKSVERRRRKWKRNHGAQICTNSERKAKRKLATRPRTTRMLVIILLLCVMVELPMGFLNLCVAMYGEDFGMRYYDPLGNLMEMLTLLYSSVSFVLYCSMSNDFLSTFRSLFLPCVTNEDADVIIGKWTTRREEVLFSNNIHLHGTAQTSLLS